MDLRYVVAGTIITSTSAIFVIYSLVSNAGLVLGPSLAVLALGVVVLVSGVTFNEPNVELLKLYVNDLSRTISKVLEDSGLLNAYRLRVCLSDLRVVLSLKPVKCSDITLGFGLASDSPYVALPVDLGKVGITEVVGDDLSGFLSEVLSRRFKVCRYVRILSSSDEYVVELNTINQTIYDFIKIPLSYVKILTLFLIAKFLGRDVELVNEELVGSNYVVKVRVV
ncbi:MAG: hypothetical protein N3G48_07335 [Sulfolobales archaeon]|nr:hypothetical protein [Sulfolobales archaeon]MCX8186899.1 hypothetical protein [Sulfolobales archaeon]